MLKDGIKETIGKTIRYIIVSFATKSLNEQIILVFTDGSYYELYGKDMHQTSHIADSGGLEAAVNYARECGGFGLKIFSN